SQDSQGFYPSRLCIFDKDGALLRWYWHPGPLHDVVIGAERSGGDPLIIVSAVNVGLRGPMHFNGSIGALFALDPKSIKGEAPPYAGRSGRGTQLWYGVLQPARQSIDNLEILDIDQDGRNEISFRASPHEVFYLRFDGEKKEIRSDEAERPRVSFKLIQVW
ncbi:MAG: hypothetical protein QOF63_266, partial [Thermoanaerobaculia bacterium]|nr:hypothetical protein [Thermoanaerobaculia bacterium]